MWLDKALDWKIFIIGHKREILQPTECALHTTFPLPIENWFDVVESSISEVKIANSLIWKQLEHYIRVYAIVYSHHYEICHNFFSRLWRILCSLRFFRVLCIQTSDKQQKHERKKMEINLMVVTHTRKIYIENTTHRNHGLLNTDWTLLWNGWILPLGLVASVAVRSMPQFLIVVFILFNLLFFAR